LKYHAARYGAIGPHAWPFNGFVEEIGWTGFLTPRLKLKENLIAAGFNAGLMWGIWHFPSNFIGSAVGAGTLPLPFYMAGILFSFLPPFRVLMTWVYKYTGSLFLAILMHASLDVFWILSTPDALTGRQPVIWYILWAEVLWMVVLIIRKGKPAKPELSTFDRQDIFGN